jgi:hypothetical protein
MVVNGTIRASGTKRAIVFGVCVCVCVRYNLTANSLPYKYNTLAYNLSRGVASGRERLRTARCI